MLRDTGGSFCLQYHNECSCGKKQDPDHGFYGQCFAEQKCGKQNGDDDGQLIDRNDLGDIPNLQRMIIAEPRCAGCQARKNQKQPALAADIVYTALRVGQKDHAP